MRFSRRIAVIAVSAVLLVVGVVLGFTPVKATMTEIEPDLRLLTVSCGNGFLQVACGDGENDRELLDWAGYRVAVANAHDEILERADLVVPDVEHEGVAQLLDAYLDSLP